METKNEAEIEPKTESELDAEEEAMFEEFAAADTGLKELNDPTYKEPTAKIEEESLEKESLEKESLEKESLEKESLEKEPPVVVTKTSTSTTEEALEEEVAIPATKEGDLGTVWEGASEEQLIAFREVVHKLKSDEGRVPGLQRELESLRKEVKKGQKTPEDFIKSFSESETWKAVEEKDPDLAEQVLAMVSGVAISSEERVKAIEDKQKTSEDATSLQLVGVRDARILKEVPEFKTLLADPNWDLWFASQPPSVHAAAEGDLYSGEDTIGIMKNFKNFLALKKPPSAATAKEVASLNKKRKAQLESGTTTESKGGSAVVPIAEGTVVEEDALFDMMADKYG